MKKKAIAVAAMGAMALPATASAHVSVVEPEVPSDGFAYLDFAVPHGCDEAGTTEVRVQIPEGVPLATPEVEPGWDLKTKTGPKEEVELFGDTITEGVSEVVWTADEPLPPDFVNRFTIEVKLPAGEPGEPIYFPTIQTCEKGETAWVEIPAEGESSDELESPAPEVVLTDAEAEGRSDAHSDDASADGEEAADTDEAEASDSDEDDGDGMQVAALVLGGLGFLFGGASLARSRKS